MFDTAPARKTRKLLRNALVVSVYIGLVFGSYLWLQSHLQRDTTERVFVYDELTERIPRMKACNCIAQLTPVILSGYTLSEQSGLEKASDGSATGGIITITTTELERLDVYYQNNGGLTRNNLRLHGESYWVYQ